MFIVEVVLFESEDGNNFFIVDCIIHIELEFLVKGFNGGDFTCWRNILLNFKGFWDASAIIDGIETIEKLILFGYIEVNVVFVAEVFILI